MNEAERYLEEKLNPSRPKKPDAIIEKTPSVVSNIGVPRDKQPSPVPQQGGSAAGKYILAVFACLGVLIVGAMIAASIGVGRHIANRNIIGYIVIAAIFMAMIGTWTAITSKR